MSNPRPEIFISATSADLRSYRQLIKEALLNIGCAPVEQSNFPPSASTVRDMLRKKIADCTAVVHVAGEVYGAEPKERAADEPRRSYTQIEYDIARELGKKVYVFICGSEFDYDPHEAESPELASLQAAHREQLQAGDHLFVLVDSKDDLSLKIHQVQEQVEKLKQELRQSRKHLRLGLLVGLGALCLLAVGLWFVNQRSLQQSEEIIGNQGRIAAVETELDKQRRYIKSVADAYTQQQSEIAELKLTDAEKFERALARVAASEGLPAEELRSAINLFVVAIENDPTAEFYDQALADFAQQRFAASAENAGKAAQQARGERLAAETLVAAAEARANTARKREREALELQGNALSSNGDYEAAVSVFQEALLITDKEVLPEAWASLQYDIGLATSEWSSRSEGDLIDERRALAIQGYGAALEVYTREALPQDWAATQSNLANALRDQASASAGAERGRLLGEAVVGYRAASEVFTREALPEDWATIQNNLANVLREQAFASSGTERGRLMEEAVAVYRAALEVRTREALPQDWATTQNNLANALQDQALTSEGAARARLLGEAIAAYRAALEVKTREALPQDWAGTQNNLAAALRAQARVSEGGERARLLEAAIVAYRSALQVKTREALPQDWAMTQSNLGAALRDQASASEGSERARLLQEAVAGYRSALEVRTRESLPQGWAATQNSLANALYDQALASEGAARARLLEEVVAAYRLTLEVYTREALPQGWVMTQNNLAIALRDQARVSEGVARARLLGEAVAAWRSALEVYTRDERPLDWAATQNNLSGVYAILLSDSILGDSVTISEVSHYAQELAIGCSHVLEVYRYKQHPALWLYYARNAAYHFILGNDFKRSEEWSNRALENVPDDLWALGILAHATLFQGRYEEALSIYKTYWDAPQDIGNGMTFREAVVSALQDFARYPHLTHPDIERLKNDLGIDLSIPAVP